MPLVRTPYGLIYNTDGSLCATLLPEGGVAVTEGTTNLCDPAYMYTNTWTTIDYAWGRRTIIDCTAGDVFTISADIRNLSQGEDRRWGGVGFHDSGGIELEFYHAMGSGMSEQRLSFTTPPAPMGTVEARVYWVSVRDGFSYQGKNFQIEKKPYDTPFVDGTRPAGRLSIPLIKERHSAGNITLSTTITCNGDDYYVDVDTILRVINTEANNAGFYIVGTGPSGGNKLKLSYMLDGQFVDLYTNISAKIGIKQKLTLVVDGREVYLYQDGSLLWSGTIPEWGSAVAFNQVQFMGVKSQTYENTLISPSVVSPETIATWHSLDAPFYDPREITTAELAAKEYAEAQAELARVTAEAYADGRVTEEEQARIADAQQKLQEAKQYADQKAAEDIDASKRTIYAGNIEFTGEGQKNTALGSDGVRRVVYEQDIFGNQKYYDKDTGEHMFTITNRGELRDKDNYPIIDINGRYNGRVIRAGFLSSTDFGSKNIIPIAEYYVIPEGRQMVTMIFPFNILIPPSDPNKTLKAIGNGDHIIATFAYYTFERDGQKYQLMSNILPAGAYWDLKVNVNHDTVIDYDYTDGTSEGIGLIFPAYYEIKEISV